MPAPDTRSPITRADIEGKFRELQGDIDTATDSAKSYAIVGGAVALVAVIGVVFWLGRRRGKKTSTVVEIRRV